MKLKKWLAASAAAMILVSGASAVSAASITTAGDQKLDLGSSISVLPGERTFFGGQFHDWLLTGNVEGTIQEILAQGNVFPENSVNNKQFASVAASILKSAKVYQVCASANDTYYQGMVLSIAVSDNDMTKLLLALNAAQAEASPVIEPETAAAASADNKVTEGKAAPAAEETAAEGETVKAAATKAATEKTVKAEAKKETKKEAKEEKSEIKNSGDVLDGMQTAWGKKVEITENSHWEDKVSKNGLSYRTGSVKALVHKDGFVIPVFAKGIITRSGTSTIYTVFVADQASGKYLDTFFDKALEEAGK
ncbi:hypothetical protein [Dialister hominis]|jgi:hypothetical protein|uniref:hypothetical protein n=1 Tax=Dialister hominis TaxID=2582419 RepID=UPI00033FD95D|nr:MULTISPECIES: hypothetical protein [environmental samples]MBP6060026.1 hypothetical protein [Dialister sp.]MEE1349623.1 hypothetical protein [Dialister hominis]CDD79944.1 putative uncharacterized protein [Dialister sp. CAG:357]HJI43492.1 hypothetical protein [Veillonellaceae bacterium]